MCEMRQQGRGLQFHQRPLAPGRSDHRTRDAARGKQFEQREDAGLERQPGRHALRVAGFGIGTQGIAHGRAEGAVQ